MHKFLVKLIGIAFISMAVSCSSSFVKSPGGSLQNGGVKPAAFDVKGQTTGKACVSRFLGVNWSGLFHDDSSHIGPGSGNPFVDAWNEPILGHAIVDIALFYPILINLGLKSTNFNAFHGGAASSAAAHQALSKVPSATYFVTASSTRESNFYIFSSNECVTVRGHALQAKGPSTKAVVR